MLDETRIRLEAIHFVRSLRERWIAVPAAELRAFEFAGRRIFVKGQSGIFKPAELTEPLSITTTIDSDYTHDVIEGSRVLYDFVSRPQENDLLKRCAEGEIPLIYFLQARKRPSPEYIVFAPVYVVGWDDVTRRFLVDLSEQKPGEVASPAPAGRQLELRVLPTPGSPSEIRELTRSYAVTSVQRRLHEARFRNAVLEAYRDRCAVCALHVRPLLDAARIGGDGEAHREVAVSEGIALCATHRRAFDCGILSFDDEYRICVELPDGTGEGERAMLLAYEGQRLHLPREERDWPLRGSPVAPQ